MNPDLFKEVVDFISENEYPTLATKGERFVIKRRAANYILQDGELYYIKNKGTAKELRLKVLCGSEAADQVFQEFHCSSFGAHCGQIKTRDAICKRYYWPGMTLDIDGWVSSCVVCQSKGCSIKKNVEYTPILVNSPFELVGMDLIGKLTTTEDGYQYICVMIDYFTKWPQAYPLKSKSASEVTKCIVKFFHQFEAPKRILTDQGKEFVNAINRDVCEILGIKRSLCAPYHPQTNGLVEKMNATIQRALGKLVSSKPNMWDQYLDAVMFGLRTKKQITTKHSPFFLMFGREARYPSEIPEHYQVGTEVEEVVAEEEVFSGIKQQEKIFQVLRKQNVDAAEKKKQDSREKIQCTYNTGDLVWRQNIRSQQRKGGKLDPDFLGPFTVTRVEGKSADLVDSCGKVLPKVSIDHLKPYIEEMPRIPHNLKANTKPQNINTTSTNFSASAATIPASTTTNTSTVSSAPSTTTASTISSAFTTTTASTISSASTTTNVFTASSTTNAYMTSSATTTTPASNISHDTVESYITDAWNGKAPHVLLSRIGPYAVFFWDIARTAPNQELEDSVMNSYLLILVRRYNETHREEALAIDSFEMSQIWKNEKTKLKIDPMRFNIILGIINQHHHWMLMIIFPKQQRAILMDPFKATPLKLRRCLQSTRTFMKGRGCAVGKWTCETLPHPVQKDSVSCGVFSLKFAEKVLCNETADRIEFPSSKEDLDKYRKEIARTVLEETDDLSEMCLYCGLQDGTKPKSSKHDSTVNWIQCEQCCRWFHQECVGNEEDFLCPACT